MLDIGFHGSYGVLAGAVGLGVLHGLEPGHGWPVAGAWALARKNPRWSGVLAACVLGIGHLISSIAVVGLFFAAKQYFQLGQAYWINEVAGVLLLGMAVWQLRAALRSGGHHHAHGGEPNATAGLGALAVFAFTLGFVHEEEFQIMAMCAGATRCLTLMLTYAVAVIGALVVLTLLLIVGLSRLSHRIAHAEQRLTLLSAAILALMGMGFIVGVL
ncbi:hypothetical protein V5738_02055 [Salinisphaera sp. SPP-AMP-43]|uniref:hypothetical protein n=1 Tax=Salinisphaera sp. SPP-AMP-43 TaxID=3121288 RepID=UPI003C6E4AE8